jgi:glycyl-tRNA synthetase alpha subunit
MDENYKKFIEAYEASSDLFYKIVDKGQNKEGQYNFERADMVIFAELFGRTMFYFIDIVSENKECPIYGRIFIWFITHIFNAMSNSIDAINMKNEFN